MVTTPNMGLVLPDENGSLDVWGAILDTIFGATKIDGHDHSTGKGVKVPSSGLNINADVSWASHAATDLLAIDFAPSPAASMTGFAGALFVADGTGGLTANELYWRTTSGSNVKVTAGAALNVAAFTGGIGGDYSAAGALVIFDDATDSYWFQQQVGSAVRQYARMRSADVDLYEFKANPAAGVPANRVRLASPTALAGSYALTLPAALPTQTRPLQVNSAGSVLVNDPVTRMHSSGMIAPGSSGGTFNNVAGPPDIVLGVSTGSNYCPLVLNVGETISAWSVALQKGSAAGTITAKLFQRVFSTLATTQIGATQSNGAAAPGIISLGQSGLSTLVQAGVEYSVVVNGGGTAADFLDGYSVTVI